jgi:hypothetical protein
MHTASFQGQAMSQQVVGHVGGTRRTIRWAAVDESPWIHAEDLCNALGWQRPERTLCALQSNVAVASALGIQIGSADDRYVDRAGVMELCARRTGGQTQGVKNLVLAKIFHEAVDYESDGECEHVEPQEEPMLPASEVVAMELLAQHRVEATLTQARALKARAEVLQEYRALGGDIEDMQYESARQTLLKEMKRPYPTQYISAFEYVQFQGYPEASALELAARFGPDMKRAYRAEYGRDPLTYVAVFPGATNNVCIYDRIHDAELLGSCWRMFQRGRSWFKENYAVSTQRKVDQRHLLQMSQGVGDRPAPGWGPVRTRSLTDRPAPF